MGGAKEVTIVEVGPRDGFQNLAKFIPTEKKADIIDRLVSSGIKHVEFSAFVHPKWIPQLADAFELYVRIPQKDGVTYRALIPNEKGLERAIQRGVKEVIWVVGATDSGNLSNLNITTEQSLQVLCRVGARVREAGVKLYGVIAYALGDRQEGDIPVEKIMDIAMVFRQTGSTDISIADSIGIASPMKIREIVSQLAQGFTDISWSIHLHDILGLGIANAFVAWEVGIRVSESSIAGLGGCPYALYPGGNIATEELVYMFHKLGVKTGIDLNRLIETRDFVRSVVGEDPVKQVGHPPTLADP